VAACGAFLLLTGRAGPGRPRFFRWGTAAE